MINLGRRAALMPLFVGGLLGMMLQAAPVRAQLAIQPAYVVADLERGRPSGKFMITNASDEEQRYRIQADFFNYSPTGQLISPPRNHPKSMADWIRFNPKEFVVPPKSTQAIRYVILPRGSLRAGEYWAAMSLDHLSVRRTAIEGQEDRTLSIAVTTSLLIPMFGTYGDVEYAGRLVDVALISTQRGPAIRATVENTGTGRLYLKGRYRLLDDSGEEIAKGEIGSSYVMAGALRHFVRIIEPDLPDGTYTAEVMYGMHSHSDRLEMTKTLEWAAPPETEADDEGSDGDGVASADAATSEAGEGEDGDDEPGARSIQD